MSPFEVYARHSIVSELAVAYWYRPMSQLHEIYYHYIFDGLGRDCINICFLSCAFPPPPKESIAVRSTAVQATQSAFDIQSKIEVILRLTVSQSVCLGVEPTLELVTRWYFLSERWCLKVAIFFLSGALSDERTGL
jgi:hypothetical protein